MRNGAIRAILNPRFKINEITAALVSERIKGTATEHTVEEVAVNLMARKILTVFIFKIFTAIFHYFYFSGSSKGQ